MYDNAELDSTFSERARRIWVNPMAYSSTSNTLQPHLADVQDGRRKTSVLILTDELEGKIQNALALGLGHKYALNDVKRWKHELLLKQADNTGSLEVIEHRLNVKRLAIEPNKEPTEMQKKTLEKLAQGVERLKANRKLIEEKVMTLDRNLARGLDRWCKAWTDVDRMLAKVWRDAGRLRSEDDSDINHEDPAGKSNPKDNEKRKEFESHNNNDENIPLALSNSDRNRQRQSERRQSNVSDWRRSVESTPNGRNIGAQVVKNLDKGKGVSTHHRQNISRSHPSEGNDGFLNHLGDLVAGIRDQKAKPPSLRTSFPPSMFSQIESTHLAPPSVYSRGGSALQGRRREERSRSTYRERHRESRSRSPRRDSGPCIDAPRYRARESPENKQDRTRGESSRGRRSRNLPKEDLRNYRYGGGEER